MTERVEGQTEVQSVRIAAREAFKLLREELAKQHEIASDGGGPTAIQPAHDQTREEILPDKVCGQATGMEPVADPLQPSARKATVAETRQAPDLSTDETATVPVLLDSFDKPQVLVHEADRIPVEAIGAAAEQDMDRVSYISLLGQNDVGEKLDDTSAELMLDGSAAQDIKTDLSQLPRSGPGLIWMLQGCNIHSLADLAGAEAVTLTAQLGAVGRIMNVQAWIDFAQSQCPR